MRLPSAMRPESAIEIALVIRAMLLPPHGKASGIAWHLMQMPGDPSELRWDRLVALAGLRRRYVLEAGAAETPGSAGRHRPQRKLRAPAMRAGIAVHRRAATGAD